jgi:hypothetical protein
MDVIEGLPLSDNANVILVVVDHLPKYAHFLPLKHPYTESSVAKLYLDSVVRLHGVPLSIISDRDKIFTSLFWKELIKAVGTKLNYTTAYHPQTDGQSERVNQCLEQYLWCAVQDSPKQWRKWLAMAEFWYNSSYHTAIGCSPFKTLYNTEPNFGAFPNLIVADGSPAMEEVKDFQLHNTLLRDKLLQAQRRMKSQANRKRSERRFTVGEQVLLKLQPYAQQTVVNRSYPKLSYKFFGPFTVLERIDVVAYRLQLPATAQVHPVFHVSQLKPFVPKYTPVFREMPDVPDLASFTSLPGRILDRRLVRAGNAVATQVLIKWSGLEEEHATWEDYHRMKHYYPSTSLWEEDRAQGGGGECHTSYLKCCVGGQRVAKRRRAGPGWITGGPHVSGGTFLTALRSVYLWTWSQL